jgi:spore maturation protein SpmB
MPERQVSLVITELQKSLISYLKAKDIFRASGFLQMYDTNLHVARDIKNIKQSQSLSPILLIRGSMSDGGALTIAAGYHRTCARYSFDENIDVPCKIANFVKALKR